MRKNKEKEDKRSNEPVIIPKGTNFNEPEEKKVWTGEELVNLNVKTGPGERIFEAVNGRLKEAVRVYRRELIGDILR